MEHGWTLEKQKWDHLLSVISGTYWSKTRLNPLYRESIPESPGVYAICVKFRTPHFNQSLFKDLYNIIYVGESTTSLRRRFLEHCRDPKDEIERARDCFGDNFEYWHTINSNRIDELQTYLIECFGPPANLIGGRIIRGEIKDPRAA